MGIGNLLSLRKVFTLIYRYLGLAVILMAGFDMTVTCRRDTQLDDYRPAAHLAILYIALLSG